MLVSYKKLDKLLEKQGESYTSLFKKGVITDFANRKLRNNDYVDLKHIAMICRYFDVPIEEVVEVITKSEKP